MRQRWSIHEPGRVAARMPSGIGITTEAMRRSSVSSAEAGRRLRISVATGWPVVSELPKSPCERSVVYRKNCSISGLSSQSFLRICSTASLVAAGPAKYAAGSPGSARVKRNVTITTPIRLGIANISRLPIMVSMRVVPAKAGTHNPRRKWLGKASTTPQKREHTAYGSPPSRGRRLCVLPSRATQPHLRLHQRAVIQPAVEPVLIAGDVLLHGDVDERLVQRDAGNVGEGQIDEALHIRVIGGRIARGRGIARAVDQPVHLRRLVAHGVEHGIVAVIAPVEEV